MRKLRGLGVGVASVALVASSLLIVPAATAACGGYGQPACPAPTASPAPTPTPTPTPTLAPVVIKPVAVMKKVRLTVRFGVMSSVLSPMAKSQLKALAEKTKKSSVRVVSIGFVQRRGSATNNQTLSLARARVVSNYLRSFGVQGAREIFGAGVGGPAAADLKVVVTITYRV